MFGSSFFYIQSCSNNAIVSPCILAVNQNGLSFLSKETHVSGGAVGGPGSRGHHLPSPPNSCCRDRAGQHCEMWWQAGGDVPLQRGQGPWVWPQQARSARPCPPCARGGAASLAPSILLPSVPAPVLGPLGGVPGACRPSSPLPPGARRQVLAEGDPVDADAAADGRVQLPLRGDHAGRAPGPGRHPAAAGAGGGHLGGAVLGLPWWRHGHQ